MTTCIQNTPELARLLVNEILLTEQRFLQHIPSCGRGIYLEEDVILRWSDEQVYRLVQGDWIVIPPESIPVASYLPHLRRALENRRELANKRIAKLVLSLASIDELVKALHSLNLVALPKALRASAEMRGK